MSGEVKSEAPEPWVDRINNLEDGGVGWRVGEDITILIFYFLFIPSGFFLFMLPDTWHSLPLPQTPFPKSQVTSIYTPTPTKT